MAFLTGAFETRGSGNAGLKDFLRRRVNELLGFSFFLTSLLLLLVLATYDHQDPSLDVASDKIAANIGGPPGALVADILMQYFGLAAVLIPLALAVWSLRFMLNHPPRGLWLRILTLPLALVVAAASLGVIPTKGQLGIEAGLGGSIGALLLDPANSHSLGSHIPGFAPISPFFGMGAAALAGLLLLLVLGLSWGEWRQVGRSAGKASRVGGEAVAKSWTAEKPKQRAPKLFPAVLRYLPRRPRGVTNPFGKPADKPEETAPRQMPSFGAAPAPAPPKAAPVIDAAPPSGARRLLSNIVAPKVHAPAPGKKAAELRQPSLNLDLERDDTYSLPSLSLLAVPIASRNIGPSEDALQQNALLLLGVLEDFGVRGEIVKVRPGPVVTLYELEPAPGTKSSRVIGLADDIARSMSAVSVRVAVVPGRNVIGIELPNTKSETVYLREMLSSDAYERSSSPLPLILGKDIGGSPVMADLAKMPHLLIAGTTGSGKSVGINTMILSILYKLPPDRCKFIMIDPKMLELSIYDGIPHLLAPVVTDPKKAVVALKWTVREMENRYRSMSKLGVRNIEGYNARLAEAAARGEKLTRRVQTGFDSETGEPEFEDQELGSDALPFIVVVVDEMADLMLVAGKEIEAAVQRLAQMARAAGIHIIMATQRPSVDVITGTIKANFPTRISFQVTSKIDSRTILGESGAEQLLGRGDMLYMSGGGRITRVHGPFVSDGEVESVVNFLKAQEGPRYIDEVTEEDLGDAPASGARKPARAATSSMIRPLRSSAANARHRPASSSAISRLVIIGPPA